MVKIEVREISVTEVKPYENNPRVNDHAVSAVAESIQRFGFRSPIVCDKDMVIICGHTRLKAALSLGLQTVPVHIAKDLSPEQVQALRIADNKTAELADWDEEALSIELQKILDMDGELLVGFKEEEVSALLDFDRELLNISEDQDETSTHGAYLHFDKLKIPLTEDEKEAFRAMVGKHEDETGSLWGFVGRLNYAAS